MDSVRALALEDRPRVEAALAQAGRVPAEYSFANLFLFRGRHAYQLAEEPVAHIRGVTYDGVSHGLPLTEPTEDEAEALLQTGLACLFPMPRVQAFSWPDRWNWHFVDDDSDYWFDGRAMAEMRFARHRRDEAIAFADAHDPVLEPWNDTDALDILQGWFGDVGRPMEATDFNECREGIALAEELGLEGVVMRTGEGEPAAFLLASRRADSIRVVHFAKGRRLFTGCYPWIFAHYARMTEAPLLNFEQDLGNSGLAQSKRAFAPIERRPKWRVRFQA